MSYTSSFPEPLSVGYAARSARSPSRSAPARWRLAPILLTLALLPLAWLARSLIRRPISTLAHLGFSGAALFIIVNALWFQSVPPPAVIAGHPRPAPVAAVPPAAVQPPEAPAVEAGRVPPQRPRDLEAPRPAAAPAASPRAAADPLGDLIRTGQVGAPPRPPADIRPAADAARPVLAAQRALNRIGYGPILADGVFGEQTRAALERFERDRKLTVTRDLSPRTLRELASVSGVRME